MFWQNWQKNGCKQKKPNIKLRGGLAMVQKKRYGMVIDLAKCIGCHACSTACKAENQVEPGVFRTNISEEENGKFPHVDLNFKKQACMHCQNAPCVNVCPTGASKYSDLGLVELDSELCVGCGYCVEACPYVARMFEKKTGLPGKCSLCSHRLKEGNRPACETTCIGKAIVSGDLNDSSSEIVKVLARGGQAARPELGTKPNIFYIAKRR